MPGVRPFDERDLANQLGFTQGHCSILDEQCTLVCRSESNQSKCCPYAVGTHAFPNYFDADM